LNTFQEISRRLRYGLIIQTLLSLLGKLGFYMTPFYVHLEGNFGQDCDDLSEGFAECEALFLGPREMKTIAELPYRKESKEELLIRLDEGKKCFAVKCNGDLAAFTWCDFERCNSSLYSFKLEENEAYLFDAYTLIPFRGRKIAPYLRCKCYQALEALGINKFYSITLYFNEPAVRFKKKLHARPIMLAIHMRLFKKWRWTWKIKSYNSPIDEKL